MVLERPGERILTKFDGILGYPTLSGEKPAQCVRQMEEMELLSFPRPGDRLGRAHYTFARSHRHRIRTESPCPQYLNLLHVFVSLAWPMTIFLALGFLH